MKFLSVLKSPATLVLVFSALLGAINAVQPMLHPEAASLVAVVATVLGTVLAHYEKQAALMTMPPNVTQPTVEPPQTIVH